MMFTAPLLAVIALLPGLASASPTPIQKRYTGATIRSGRTNTCLTLAPGTNPSNGAPLTVGDCSTATKWDINPGSGSVIVTGTNFALDAGVNPHNNVPAKVWQSYPGSTQQTWYLTDDNRIAITGGNQCLDEGDNGPQTYQCTTGNTNQVWYVNGAAPPPASSSASKSSTPSSSKASASSTPTGTSSNKYTLRWKSNTNLCATVQGSFQSGTVVNLQQCSNSAAQQFTYNAGGVIQVADTSSGAFCLDAGSNPGNGIQMKIWQCYPGAPQQTWSYPYGWGNGLFQTANNQCLDVNNQGNLDLQTWTCSQNDPQQQFIFTAV